MVGALVVAALALGTAGCSSSAPEVPAGADGNPDPVLAEGRGIFTRRCAGCHGSAGGGGRGPALDDGRVVERYPDMADQVELVHQGRGGMPGFADVLSDAEIQAVVRYTREVLDT